MKKFCQEWDSNPCPFGPVPETGALDQLGHLDLLPQVFGDTLRVVVIASGKGGVDKTTTTANVGLSLARFGFSVVAIDADVSLRNLDLLFGLENRVNYTAVEVLNGDCASTKP
ncbi:hypothetical protein Scep_028924 [Stephania cephalantha]|uniref:CobQ/CobB/MinD/ParA nucleotide binding domain-containing protein n=1 Tax=Stephania cephalantha TaxID=152367 RepID=A0AAP0EDZ1_9MAGN